MPIHNCEMSVRHKRRSHGACESCSLRHAMKCVCYEHKISRLRYHLVDIISVSFDKLAIGDAVLNETNVGQVQEIAVDINRGDVPRKPGDLQCKPAIPGA